MAPLVEREEEEEQEEEEEEEEEESQIRERQRLDSKVRQEGTGGELMTSASSYPNPKPTEPPTPPPPPATKREKKTGSTFHLNFRGGREGKKKTDLASQDGILGGRKREREGEAISTAAAST